MDRCRVEDPRLLPLAPPAAPGPAGRLPPARPAPGLIRPALTTETHPMLIGYVSDEMYVAIADVLIELRQGS